MRTERHYDVGDGTHKVMTDCHTALYHTGIMQNLTTLRRNCYMLTVQRTELIELRFLHHVRQKAGHFTDFLSHHMVVWLGYLVYCVFVFLYGYGFLSGGKRQLHEISHACSTTIREQLLPFGQPLAWGGSPRSLNTRRGG